MPAWFDQDELPTESAQPCGCDMGCKPKPHYCRLHDPENTAPDWWRSRGPQKHVESPEFEAAMREAYNSCTKGPEQVPEVARQISRAMVGDITTSDEQLEEALFPQDATAAASVLGDICPRCGGQLDADGGQHACHCPLVVVAEEPTCPRCGTSGEQDDCRECHPARPR